MVNKKRKRTKNFKKEPEYDYSKFDNFIKKYGIFVFIGIGILSFVLSPSTWYNIGENVWIALPVIGILVFYSLLSGDKKQSFNLVGLAFIVIILIAAIFAAF